MSALNTLGDVPAVGGDDDDVSSSAHDDDISSSSSESSSDVGSDDSDDGVLGGVPMKLPHCSTQDIFSDYTLENPFFVDGDALVHYVVHDKLINWTLGGQLLHFVHALESVLEALLVRGCKIKVVFFQVYKTAVWTEFPIHFRLAREVAVLHLMNNVAYPGLEVAIVNSWLDCPGWKDLLDDVQPPFMLTTFPWCSQSCGNCHVCRITNSFPFCLHDSQIDVILFNGMEIRGARLFAFESPVSNTPKSRRDTQVAIAGTRPLLNVVVPQANYKIQRAPNAPSPVLTIRARALAAITYNDSIEFRALLRAAVVTSVLQEYVDLSYRCLPELRELSSQNLKQLLDENLPAEKLELFTNFLASWQNNMITVLEEFSDETKEANLAYLADLFDGRFFALITIMLHVNQNFARHEVLNLHLNRIWESLQTGTPWDQHDDLLFTAEQSTTIWNGLRENRTTTEVTKQSHVTSFLVNVHDIPIGRLLTGVTTRMAEFEQNANDLPAEEILPSYVPHHFHSTRPLEDSDDPFVYKIRDDVVLPAHVQARADAKYAASRSREIKYMLRGSPVEQATIAQFITAEEEERAMNAAIQTLEASDAGDSDTGSDTSADSSSEEVSTSQGKKKKGKPVKKEKREIKTKKEAAQSRKGAPAKKFVMATPNLENKLRIGENKLKGKMERSSDWRRDEAGTALASLLREMDEMIQTYTSDSPTKTSNENDQARIDTLGLKMRVQRLHMLVEYTKQFRNQRTQYKKRAFVYIQDTLRSHHALLLTAASQSSKKSELPELADLFASAANHFGFPQLAEVVAPSKSKKKPTESTHPIHFQLLEAPEFLKRPSGVEGDDRVQFPPDEWQRKLLDVVDAKRSALIVAPTSSGKTFISYYAMERVLRTDDVGVVVYVSPTKALVNQVALEVEARFSKRYNGSTAVCGMFTRDYRHKHLDCQILVTVPACLEILLLSKESAEWVSRLRYVIFDEIHSIGTDGGEIWERCILLAPCPFLALSATIGEVRAFQSWLRRVEKKRKCKLHLITHNERYNDLELSVFNPSLPAGQDRFVPLHTASVLKAEKIGLDGCGFPPDLKIIPEQCLKLYEEMRRLGESDPDLQRLDPVVYFPHIRNDASAAWDLSMRDIAAWEQELKNKLAVFEHRAEVIQNLAAPSRAAFAHFAAELDVQSERDYIFENMRKLIEDLKAKDMLPAIIFHLNAFDCEDIALKMRDYLEAKRLGISSAYLEQRRLLKVKFTPGTPEAKQRDTQLERVTLEIDKIRKAQDARVEALEVRAEELKELIDAKSKTKQQTEEKGELEAEMNRILVELNKISIRIDNENSFMPLRTVPPTPEEIDELTMNRMSRIKGRKNNTPLADPLRYGIGVHHAGVSTKLRHATEIFFRQRKLGVVFATGTLAVGINMPCKTVVFAGDSSYLNPMNYRQMSGRAGRRGIDLRGHIVIFGLPETKVYRLIRSPLPTLHGNLLVDMSLVLRVAMKHKALDERKQLTLGTNAAKNVELHLKQLEKGVNRLLSLPLFRYNLMMPQQIMSYFRFSLDVLRRSQLLDSKGSPNDIAAFVSHLFFTEPSNHILTYLLTRGVFSDICSQENKARDIIEREVVHILAWLFTNEPIPPNRVASLLKNRHTSTVVLTPLSDSIHDQLGQYNSQLIRWAISYLSQFSQAYNSDLGGINVLPLSSTHPDRPQQVSFPPEHLQDSVSQVLFADLRQVSSGPAIRSTFVALSGHTDTFSSVQEMSRSLRPKLFLDPQLIPTFDVDVSDIPRNAYAYDFFLHGQVNTLVTINKISRSTVFDKLKGFTLILRTIAAALEKRVQAHPDGHSEAELRVVDVFTTVTAKYAKSLSANFDV